MTTDEDSFVIIRYRSVDERRDRHDVTAMPAHEQRSGSRGGCGSREAADSRAYSDGAAVGAEGASATDFTADGAGGSSSESVSLSHCVSRCDIRCESRESRGCSICGSVVTSCSGGDQCGVADDAVGSRCAIGRGDGDMEIIGVSAHPALPHIDTAFQHISQTVSKMQLSMETMNMDMERTDEAVRGVTHRLRQQGQIVQQLHKAMTVLEKKACQLVTSTSPFPPCPAPSKIYSPLPEEDDVDRICKSSSRHRPRTRSVSCSECSFTSTRSPSPPPCSPSPSLPRPSRCRQHHVQSCSPRKRSSTTRAASKSPNRSASCASRQKKSHRSKSPKVRVNSKANRVDSKVRLPEPEVPKEPDPKEKEIRQARRTALLSKKLVKAAEKGKLNRVKTLLAAGADPNFCAAGRWTPLHKAAAEAHSKVVLFLLRKGADPNVRTTYGFSALHMAAYNDPSGRCVKHLIKANADLNVWNRSGRTPLHHAAESGNVAAVKELIKAGASKYVKNNDGRTPFHVTKSVRVRRHLLSSGRKKKRDRP